MIITIAGTYGSGGLSIAKTAAELMNYRMLDDEAVEKILKEMDLDLDPETFHQYDENFGSGSLSSLKRVSAVRNGIIGHYFNDAETRLPLEARFANALKQIALEFAKDGNCIMVGRCAGYFVKSAKDFQAPEDDLVCIFTTDTEEKCIERTREYYVLDEEQAKKLIKKRNKRREEYNKYFTSSATWGDPAHYNYILQTSTLGIEGTAKLIQAIVQIHEAAESEEK